MRISTPVVRKKSQMPLFDFLKTSSIPASPQPQKTRGKKMFLSFYRTLRTREKKDNRKVEKYREEISVKGYRREAGMVIEGLVPVSLVNRNEQKRVLSAIPFKDKAVRIRVIS